MNKFLLGFKALFRVWSDAAFAEQVQGLIQTGARQLPNIAIKKPGRNDALTLLAAMQREGRFIDFIMEGLDSYPDAQVGAVARDVHRDCGSLLKRVFEIATLSVQEENTPVDVPVGYDPARIHVTGQVAGEPPYKGVLRHHGWQVKQCELPQWTGREESLLIVAPMEVEIK